MCCTSWLERGWMRSAGRFSWIVNLHLKLPNPTLEVKFCTQVKIPMLSNGAKASKREKSTKNLKVRAFESDKCVQCTTKGEH